MAIHRKKSVRNKEGLQTMRILGRNMAWNVKMYRSRKEQWCGSAGGRGEGEDELYTVMGFFISALLNVLLDFVVRI